MNHSAVATHHPQGLAAAEQVLRAGGNAVDAAVAAMLALCVAVPGSVGLGGYGGTMVVYQRKTRRVVSLDFDSRSPLAYRDDLFAEDGAKKSTTGYLAVTVPAVVAGLAMALREFGTMSWKQVSQHAAELAERGFPMEQPSRRFLEAWEKTADPVSLRAHFPTGKIPGLGEPWIQKDLAKLFRRLADEGPESFYRGPIARAIVEQVHAHGGILQMEDFEKYQPRKTEPLRIDYRGHKLFTPPPPAGGITMLQILKTLENFELAKLKPWGAEHLHLVAEAAKQCWVDRHKYLGDPDFVKIPFDEMLSAPEAAERADEIKRGVSDESKSPADPNPHTSNICVIDEDRNVVSLTATQGAQFGSGVVIEGLGLVLGHGMSRFDFTPGHPNAPAPGKRMHHNMSPTIILKNGDPLAAIGMPGAAKIVTVTAQMASNLIDFHTSAEQTVMSPRVHTEGAEPLAVSASLGADVVADLEKLGHQVQRGQMTGGPYASIGGPANAVVISSDGTLEAAAEPPGAAAVI